MALPEDLATCTVTGSFAFPDGRPLRGQVRFTPNVILSDPGDSLVIPQVTSVAELTAGSFSITLLATDASQIVPQGWLYLIRVELQDSDPYDFFTALPSADSPLDISELTPLQPVTQMGAYLLTTGGTMTGPLYAAQDPTSALEVATMGYVGSVTAGLAAKAPCQEATTGALSPANTYNATAMTLTANFTGALTVDSIAVGLGDRVLVKDESAPAHNGIFTVTSTGDSMNPYILTRSADMDTDAQVPGAYAFTEQGDVNAGVGYIVAGTGPYTLGTTAITWVQLTSVGDFTAGTGISLSGNQVSLVTPVTVADGGTGAATAAQGDVFAGPSSGGSGAPGFRALVAADVPTLNQNTTGTAANLSGSPALPAGTTATTQTTGDSSTKLATDAFVSAAVATETTRAETAEALLAPLASPALTGTPTAPTKTALTDSTAIATTAYADAAVGVETTRAETAEAGKAGLLTPTTQTGAYTANPGDYVKANISSASWTMKLPNAPAANTIVGAKVIANATGNAHALTVACQGSDLFEQSGGSASATLSLLGQAAAWQYNGGYWTRLSDDLPLGQLSGLYQNVFSPVFYGAAGNGSTNDAAAVQAAITAASASGGTVSIDKPYLVSGANGSSALACSGTGVRITGTGSLIQDATGNNYNLLDMSGSTNCRIDGVTFTGRTGTVPASSNSGVYAVGTAGLTVRDCRFTGLLFRPVYVVNGTDCKVAGCDASACCEGFGYNSTLRASFENCTLRDPQTPVTGVFYDGYTLESTASGPSGSNHVPCQDITITGCRGKSLSNAQSVLIHAGIRVAITGNVFTDAECGISVNPFEAADICQDITISGNVVEGTGTSQNIVVTDGVLNGTTTVTSASAPFTTTGSPGRVIAGTGIPANTTIASVTNSTTAVMSHSATTSATGVTLTIGTIFEVASTGINVSGGGGLATLSCTTTSSSATLTTTGSFTTAGITAGMQVSGTGIPSNCQVASVQSATSLTLSQDAVSSGTSTITFFTGSQNVTIAGNTIRGFNAIVQNAGAGGIGLGYATGVTCTGNTITGCYGNGIVVFNPCTDLIITGNEIDNVQVIGGVFQVGIELLASSAGSSGHIGANLIDGGAGLLSGIRADGASGAVKLLADNTFQGVFTNKVTLPNNLAAISETSHLLVPNPPVSGTVYRNDTGLMGNCVVFLPAWATSSGTPGTVAVSVTTSNTVSNVFTKQVSGSTSSSLTDIVMFVVPPDCYWAVTLTGVTLGAGYAQRL